MPPSPGNRQNQKKFALVIRKNKKNLVEESKIWNFCTGYRLNPRKSVNSCHFYRFLVVLQ